MELPDDVLALVRAYARPRVSTEALGEYNKIIQVYGDWPQLKRVMVTPHAIQLVRAYNQETDLIEELQLLFRETPLHTTSSAHIRNLLRERYDVRRLRRLEIQVLFPDDLSKPGGYTY